MMRALWAIGRRLCFLKLLQHAMNATAGHGTEATGTVMQKPEMKPR